MLLPRAAAVEAAPVGGGAAVHAAPSPRGHGPERPQAVRQPPSPSDLGPPPPALLAAAAVAVVALGAVAPSSVGGGGGGGGGGGLGGGAVRGALLVHLAVLLLDLWKTRTGFVQRPAALTRN